MLSLRLVLLILFTFSAALAVWRPMVALAASPPTVRAQKFIDAHVAKLTASGMKKSDEEDARSRIWASLSGAARHGQIDKQLVQGTKVSQVALAERGGR